MKEKINHEQRLLSMFEFRMIMEMMYANENRIQGQNELLASIGVDTSFRVISQMRFGKSARTGKWMGAYTILDSWKDETWYETWYEFVRNKTPERIRTYFVHDDYKF